MGWKNVKEHYRIEHIVHVRDGCVCVGSPYISDIIVIAPDGTLRKRFDGRGNDNLDRYQREFDADPAKLRRLIEAPDTFATSIPVYTYDGGRIIEKQCETFGWPNCTHDGDLMYANQFSTDRALVVRLAKRDAEIGIKWARENIEAAETKLAEARARLAEEEANRAKLEADYPTCP